MKRRRKRLCHSCLHGCYDGVDALAGCALGLTLVTGRECYEYQRVQEPRKCDRCHRIALEWERLGPHTGEKETVCRACMCPELPPPEILPWSTTPLADIAESIDADVHVSVYGMNRQLDKRHDELGYPRRRYEVWARK